MRNLRLHLWNNVFTHDIRWYEQYLWNRMEDFSTLLLGETGTGKGTAAAAIGRSGFIPYDEKKGCFTESFTRNFIAINLSQFAESLIESELFGHKKGAFTGAVEHHDGVFTRCTPYGSIFLDEVGDISVPIQVKLPSISISFLLSISKSSASDASDLSTPRIAFTGPSDMGMIPAWFARPFISTTSPIVSRKR